ncbi:MAG: hypothetical protein ACODAD_04825 [Planctomycetota bacterium]
MSQTGPAYVDDPTIADDSPLWRRIAPQQVIYDENLGRHRPTSDAFQNHRNGSPMSVVLGQDVLDAGRNPESVLEGHEEFSLAAITAGLAREKEQGIQRAPLPEEPAHAEVFGKKTKSVQKAFSKASQWVVPPSMEDDAS